MKTKHEIIDEIAGHYNLGNRSIGKCPHEGISDDNYCLYNGPNGEHCAFAYMCIDPSKLIEGKNSNANLAMFGDGILKEEFRGHDIEFYRNIQSLHDYKPYWTEEGLSKLGKIRVIELKEEYA